MTTANTPHIRVNARFDGTAKAQLAYIVEQTGLSVSDVLKASVARYYEELRASRANPFEMAQELGLVGAFSSGDPTGSSSVKQVVAEALERKRDSG